MSIEEYKKFARNAGPAHWHNVAGLLHDNATTLYNSRGAIITFRDESEGIETTHFTVNRSVFLLSGFAMENLIKAYLIYENPEYIGGGKLSNKITTHKLSKLLMASKHAPYKKRFLPLFTTLESGLNSWARYPTGLNYQSDMFERHINEHFWEFYNKGFNALNSKLKKLLSKSWTNPYGEKGRYEFG